MPYSPYRSTRLSRPRRSESSEVPPCPCSMPTGKSPIDVRRGTFRFRRTFRRGICDLKLWPNVPPDVKHNSSTPGKTDAMVTDEQTLVHQTPQNVKSTPSGPVIATANLQYNPRQITSKPLNITWNDDSAYPMLDELSRIAKVSRKEFFARSHCSLFV